MVMQGYPSGDGAVLIKRLPEVRFLLLVLCRYKPKIGKAVVLKTTSSRVTGVSVRVRISAFKLH